MDTVIVYGTNFGTSLKVAQILGDQIAGAVELVDIKSINNIDLDTVDKLIIGCGIKFGKIPSEVKHWLEDNEDKILTKEIFIYMCAGEKDEKKIEELFKINFQAQILNKSRFTTCVGGEVDLNKVGFLMRVIFSIVKRINPSIDSLNLEKISNLATKINELHVKS